MEAWAKTWLKPQTQTVNPLRLVINWASYEGEEEAFPAVRSCFPNTNLLLSSKVSHANRQEKLSSLVSFLTGKTYCHMH